MQTTMTHDEAKATAIRFTLAKADVPIAQLVRDVESQIVLARESGFAADYATLQAVREVLANA